MVNASRGEPPTPAADSSVTAIDGTDPGVAARSPRPPFAQRFAGLRSRRATYLVLGFIGVELGLIGAFLALEVLHLSAVAVPVGPVVAVIGNVATGLWAVRITGNRTAAAAPALGWLISVLLLSSSRGEGDVVITNSGRGVAFLLLGAAAWVAAAVGGRLVA